MIVECPTCAARYRLSDAVLAKGARLKCAACQHRWVPSALAPESAPEPEPPPPPKAKPLTEADEEAAFAAVQEQLLSRWAEPPAAGPPAVAAALPEPVITTTDLPPEDDTSAAGSGLARSVVAAIAGLALAVIAGGLWLGRTDLAAVPVVGDALASLEAPSPLRLEAKGIVTQLPSSRRVLEVTGTIRNPSDVAQPVPAMEATLSGPAGVALRWPIPAPVAMLPPGEQVDFASTVMAFPAEAQTLSVSLGR